jgi:agmatinase
MTVNFILITFAVQKKKLRFKAMADLTHFDPDSAGNPNNGIFGLPFTEEDAKLIILPVPWEVTVSYKAGTARATERICRASLQVELNDDDFVNGWKQ